MSSDRYSLADKEGTYFLTLTVVDWIDVFTRKEHAYVICDSLNYCIANKGLVVHAWVIMSNHMHMIAKGAPGHDISAILRDFKKFTSKALVRQIQDAPESRREWMLRHFAYRASSIKRISGFKFWEDGNHAILVNTPEKWEQRFNYLHMNPVAAGFVAEPEHYLYSSAGDYSGAKGLVNIELI
ncbi:MAG TPA: transposase [Flavobacteriales bacterium]|nr:transposase [Flavobacteriales bacterium]HRQ85668.1 transposase [Flavobacteriales bacterium]